MDRRNFLQAILALGAAPAIVRADSLMRIVPIDTLILPDDGWLEAWHDLTNTQAYAEVDLVKYDDTLLIRGELGIYKGIQFHEREIAAWRGLQRPPLKLNRLAKWFEEYDDNAMLKAPLR